MSIRSAGELNARFDDDIGGMRTLPSVRRGMMDLDEVLVDLADRGHKSAIIEDFDEMFDLDMSTQSERAINLVRAYVLRSLHRHDYEAYFVDDMYDPTIAPNTSGYYVLHISWDNRHSVADSNTSVI